MKNPQTQTQLYFQDDLPSPNIFPEGYVLIYDAKLRKKYGPWIKRFSRSMGVQAGERLKTWSAFGQLALQFQKRTQGLGKQNLGIVAFGGGSIGDACGFLASTFKRGIDLVQIPSTWLAAMDSAHGGKNGLNLGGAKNQIGTFYLPSQVFLVRSVLENQPGKLKTAAWGEIVKMGLLDAEVRNALQRAKVSDLWPLLQAVITAKMKIVSEDPQELSGKRKILNLGHTMGHVLEASLGLAHGEAVAQGLIFALELSEAEGLLPAQQKKEITEFLEKFRIGKKWNRPVVKKSVVNRMLLQDKKNEGSGLISFILLSDFGKPLIQNVSLEKIHHSLKRLKWIA